jgi:hypothetical protein
VWPTWNAGSNGLGISLFYPTKRILKCTVCQVVDPVLQKLKWAKMMQNTPFIGWPKEEDVVVMCAKWKPPPPNKKQCSVARSWAVVCMFCHASSCDCNCLYWIWWVECETWSTQGKRNFSPSPVQCVIMKLHLSRMAFRVYGTCSNWNHS